MMVMMMFMIKTPEHNILLGGGVEENAGSGSGNVRCLVDG